MDLVYPAVVSQVFQIAFGHRQQLDEVHEVPVLLLQLLQETLRVVVLVGLLGQDLVYAELSVLNVLALLPIECIRQVEHFPLVDLVHPGHSAVFEVLVKQNGGSRVVQVDLVDHFGGHVGGCHVDQGQHAEQRQQMGQHGDVHEIGQGHSHQHADQSRCCKLRTTLA